MAVWKAIARRVAAPVARVMRLLPGTSARFGPPRRFYGSLEEFARTEASHAELHALTAARPESRTIPLIADAPMRALFERMVSGQVKPQAVAVLKRGRYWGRSYGYVITQSDALVCPLSPELKNFGALDNPPREHDALKAWRLPRVEHFRGRLLVLNTLFCSNFHHWLLDTLPKFELLRRAGISIASFDGFVFDYQNNRWQNEACERLGVPRERIIASHPALHLQADELVVPTFSEPSGNPEKYSYSPEGAAFVRELFLPKEAGTVPPRRILLSRRKAAVRRLHNEAEAVAALEPHGFETLCMEDFSVAEQAAIFAAAEAVVMPHGGGLANCVFLPTGAGVIELYNPAYLPTFMLPLSTRLGLRYAAIIGVPPSKEEVDAGAHPSDKIVAPARILETLQRLLPSMQ